MASVSARCPDWGAARLQARNGRCPACKEKGICLIRAWALSSASLRWCGMRDRAKSASSVFTNNASYMVSKRTNRPEADA